MCGWFPELDREIARHVLRNGVTIREEDVESREALDRLRDLNVVTTRKHTYVRCAYRDDYDYLDRDDLNCEGRVEICETVEEYYCPECGQPIGDVERKKHFVEWEVLLSPSGIEAYLRDALSALEAVTAVDKIGIAALKVEVTPGKLLNVVVPRYATVQEQSMGLFFADPTLYVIASTIDDPMQTALEEAQYVGLWEILSEPVEAFEERVSVAATPVQDRRSYFDLEAKFDGMLERRKKRRWQFFEHDFVPAFINHVAEHPELSQRYLDKLKRLHRTVFGRHYVPIGGSGVTDLREIDKYEVMTELFEGDFIADAKCYVDSSLEYDKLTSVIAHLDTDPTEPKRAVAFVAGDNIGSTSWDLAMRLRDRWGFWRLAIIPKYLLLEMISELDAAHLLDM